MGRKLPEKTKKRCERCFWVHCRWYTETSPPPGGLPSSPLQGGKKEIFISLQWRGKNMCFSNMRKIGSATLPFDEKIIAIFTFPSKFLFWREKEHSFERERYVDNLCSKLSCFFGDVVACQKCQIFWLSDKKGRQRGGCMETWTPPTGGKTCWRCGSGEKGPSIEITSRNHKQQITKLMRKVNHIPLSCSQPSSSNVIFKFFWPKLIVHSGCAYN